MTTPTRRAALLGLGGAVALPGLARGQTTDDPFEGGIGGTGIVGVLTGLGSLRINGLRVEIDGRTRVTTPYGRVRVAALTPGLSLSIHADARPGALRARDVAIDWALVGEMRRAGDGTWRVNGARVQPERGAVGRPVEGARMAVSGLWTAGGVVASRFDPAPGDLDLIAGTAGRAAGGPTVGGVPITGAAPEPGRYAVVLGQGHGDGLAADRVQIGRASFARPLRQLAVEGYLEPVAARPGVRIAGLGHRFAADLDLAPFRGERAIYAGPYDGRFRPRAGWILPEGVGARRLRLAGGLGPAAGRPAR